MRTRAVALTANRRSSPGVPAKVTTQSTRAPLNGVAIHSSHLVRLSLEEQRLQQLNLSSMIQIVSGDAG